MKPRTPMISNFAQLQQHDEQLLRIGMLAERYFADDPNTSILKLRQLAEGIAKITATYVGIYKSPQEGQYELLGRLRNQGILPQEIYQLFTELRLGRWHKRGDSQNLYGEARTLSGPGPSALSRKGASGDPVARDGCNHSARARKNGGTLESERHPFDSAQGRLERKQSERFKRFTYEELAKRDKLNLDIFLLKDESLEDSANLPQSQHY